MTETTERTATERSIDAAVEALMEARGYLVAGDLRHVSRCLRDSAYIAGETARLLDGATVRAERGRRPHGDGSLDGRPPV